ncbi:MAG: DUF1826 domain-containing protein [Pseudomonadota bacterium]
MTLQYQHSPTPYEDLAIGKSPRVFLSLKKRECKAAVWDRNPLASFQTWLNGLEKEALPQARLILRPETVHEALSHLCEDFGTPYCRERDMLIGDIAALAHMFSDVAATQYIRLRLDAGDLPSDLIAGDKDADVKLLCLYRGQNLKVRAQRTSPHNSMQVQLGAPILFRSDAKVEMRFDKLEIKGPSKPDASSIRLLLSLEAVTRSEGAPSLNNQTLH